MYSELTNPAGEARAADLVGHVVQENGTIFFPYVGVIKVAGQPVSEVRKMLAKPHMIRSARHERMEGRYDINSQER